MARMYYARGTVLSILALIFFLCRPSHSGDGNQKTTTSGQEGQAAAWIEHHSSTDAYLRNWPCAKNKDFARDSHGKPIWLKPSETLERVTNKTALKAPGLIELARPFEGEVTVELLIDAEGNVECARGIKGHAVGITSAMAAVPKWTFKPFVINGKRRAVLARLVVPYRFEPEAVR